MKAALDGLSSRQKVALLILVCLVVGSVLYHNHPNMDDLQEQLRTRAPVMFKIFILGEGVYFSGMVMMALGLGTSLGSNLATWPGKLKDMMMSENHGGLANAKVFWLGFACNVLGSLTFASMGLYVAARILPGGALTLVPASLVDIAFSLAMRYAFYKRFSRPPGLQEKSSPGEPTAGGASVEPSVELTP
jgi:hypothetical protein